VVGSSISHYKILAKLGEGGMGVVYKAEDTKLERAVALKFLAAHLVDEGEAKERFLREAKAAAALHHPNICPVYEIDEAQGKTFLAMAFLEGEPLEDGIAKGPLPLKDALEIGRQLAEGLSAAHGKGIIHRDIKPANILVSPEGRATIMDFGLARLTEASRLTKAEQTVGTAAYMSPEQMQGVEADHRTDIWALGCVLYEMVAGVRPFQGEYAQALAYEIVNQAVEPLTGVRAGVPMELEFIVSKCMAKDVDDRYGDSAEIAKDLRTLAEKLKSGRSTITRLSRPAQAPLASAASLQAGSVAMPSTGPSLPAGDVVPRSRLRLFQAALALSVLAALAVSFLHFGEQPPERRVRRFSIAPDGLLGGIISPDGRHIAYLAGSGEAALWLRTLENETARELAAPVDIDVLPCLAWSPDSSSIAFAQDSELKRISLSGSAPVTLCKLPSEGQFDCIGATWSPDGETIIFSSGTKPYGVSAGGGEPSVLFETGGPDEPSNFWSPNFLPSAAGSEALVFDAGAAVDSKVWVADLGTGEQWELAPGSAASYSQSGHLVHGPTSVNEPGLWARPFSLDTLTPTGESFRIEQTGFLASLGQDGTMVYTDTPRSVEETLVWRDRAGAVRETVGQPQSQMARPAVSPDGRFVAVASNESGSVDIWVHDLARAAKTRLTFSEANENAPTWSPSGREIAYYTNVQEDGGGFVAGIVSKSTDASGIAAVLVDPEEGSAFDPVWLQDGRRFVYTLQFSGQSDIWYATSAGDANGYEQKPFVSTPANEGAPTPSPDGLHLAYVSDESGSREVYVRRFPDGSGRRQVSINGGTQPVWRRDGRELFYVDGTTLMAVAVSDEGGLTLGQPQALFDSEDLRSDARHPQYDVSPDGERFLTTAPAGDERGSSVIRIVDNWYEQFREHE